MPELVVSEAVLKAIRSVVYSTWAETGVRLIGVADGHRYVVEHVIGPGGRAEHQACFYECDNDYAESVYGALRAKDPRLRFLGELHVHPPGFMRLSATDRETIAAVLQESPEFIAGVMHRHPLRIYPYLFTKESEELMEVSYGDFCPEPEGAGKAGVEVRNSRRLWKRWLRRLRDARPRRHRVDRAD